MAEGSIVQTVHPTEDTELDGAECAICLQPYVYPAQLPCGHIFCFLCIKGTANQSKRCAMCRQEIPRDFMEHPHLLNNKNLKDVENYEGCYQWFYEGRNGWWQYDERTSKELETSYSSGERSCELLIAGFLYVMDFTAMLQLRRNDPSRRRRMKRDLVTIDKKGVAGLRSETSTTDAPVAVPNEIIEIPDDTPPLPPTATTAAAPTEGVLDRPPADRLGSLPCPPLSHSEDELTEGWLNRLALVDD